MSEEKARVPVSKDNIKNEQITPLHRAFLQAQYEQERKANTAARIRQLKGLLESNLITKEDYEKRKWEILSEI